MIIAVLLFIASLLPYCSTVTASGIFEIVQVFVDSCRIYDQRRKLIVCRRQLQHAQNIPMVTEAKAIAEEMQFRELGVALTTFFRVLYATFPCNLLHYLRCHICRFLV